MEKPTRYWTKVLIIILLTSGCKIANFEEEVTPNIPREGTVSYPLLYPSEPGFSGEILFEKLSDGTTNSVLKLQGLNKNYRYFGKIATSNSTDFNNSKPIADLGEINAATGVHKSWIREDYNNKAIYFDSLINTDAKIVITEIDAEKGISKVVLSGDIGSNQILEGGKTFKFTPVGNSGIEGSVQFKLRKNGNAFIETRIQGLPDQSNVEISLFLGDHESDVYTISPADKREENLNNYSGNQTVVYSNLKRFSSLDVLDTLRGFIGIKAPITEIRGNVQFLSIANLGGNISTGRKITIPIADTATEAELEFEEFCILNPRIKMKFRSIKIPKTGYYLFFKEGNTADKNISKVLYSLPISDTTNLRINDPKINYGKSVSFSDIENWDCHIEISQEFAINSRFKIDIGKNEILYNDSLVSIIPIENMNEYFLNQELDVFGTLKFYKRKSGEVISDVRINRIGGIENIITLREGPKPLTYDLNDTTKQICTIIKTTGGQGQHFERVNLKNNNGSTLLWSELKKAATDNAYFEYSFFEEFNYVLNRGTFN